MIGDLASIIPSACDLKAAATSITRCILGQIHRPYPCSATQVLHSPNELQLPRERFCAFYGSFDWHSCVHSHWALARLLASGLVEAPLREQVASALDQTLQPDLVAQEARQWGFLPAHTERPYGLSWLLALDVELGRTPLAAQHPNWRDALAPMTALAAERLRLWVEGLALPVRSGTHSDTAWSLAMTWDWARTTGANELAALVAERARALYLGDRDAPCAYEPNGETFTSSILNEAALMARVLSASEYSAWLQGFLPQVFEESRPAEKPLIADLPRTWDGTTYLGVHEVALPLARCLAARDAASALPQGSPAKTALTGQALRWGEQGLDGLVLDGYLADHWVGSFALAAIAPNAGQD